MEIFGVHYSINVLCTVKIIMSNSESFPGMVEEGDEGGREGKGE